MSESHGVIEMVEHRGDANGRGAGDGKIARAVHGTTFTLIGRAAMCAIAIMFPLAWTDQHSWQDSISKQVAHFDVVVEQLKAQQLVLTLQVQENDKQINARVDSVDKNVMSRFEGVEKSVTSRFDQQGNRVSRVETDLDRLKERFMAPFIGGKN